MFSQTLGGLGLSAGITVGALIAQELLGSDRLAGLPSAVFTLGSSLAAFLIGRLTQSNSRRTGLSVGFLLGGVGAIGVIISTALQQIFCLFLFLFIYGFGTATNLQARYAASDLAEPADRSKAISIAMVATTFGAIIGPNLSNFMSKIALELHLPPLTGSFILSALAYISSGIVLFLFLRPDPYQVAKILEDNQTDNNNQVTEREHLDKKSIFIGALIMTITQMVMVAIMTMTPVYMKMHDHGLHTVGIVIGIHIGSMYLPSLVTGNLVTKIGTYKTGILSGITLILAAVIAMISPPNSTVILSIALSLLGIGWNFGLISGTTMIVDATTLLKRPKIQGTIDVFIALAGSFGGAVSGIILNAFNYQVLGLLGIVVSVILITYIVVYLVRR